VQIDWDLIFEELENKQTARLHNYFVKLKGAGVLINFIQDEKNFNLLHHAVLKGLDGKVSFLIETAS